MAEKLPMNKIEWLVKLPIEEITWEDHFSSENWTTHDDEEIEGSIFVTTIGYRLRETKTKVILIQNRATNGQIAGTMTIIKKTIKNRTIVREAQ